MNFYFLKKSSFPAKVSRKVEICFFQQGIKFWKNHVTMCRTGIQAKEFRLNFSKKLKFNRNNFVWRYACSGSFKIWNPAVMFVASLLLFIYLFLIIIFRRKNNPINAAGPTASTKIIKRCWRRSYSPKSIRVSIFLRWPLLF